ncbi:MAG: hypothetical protein KDJ19_05245 [Hyphomicrobiaceae bacterium]|nr:hypothetical protein [Hyphomicrobiaceae bacterium]MCC0023247.1 hypothetical protein [Hyphomicrobiaceae bacterium]
MATIIVDTNSTSAAIGNLNDGDDIIVLPNVSLYVTSDSAIESAANDYNSHNVWIEGAVFSDAANAVALDQDAFGYGANRVYVGGSGSISATTGIALRVEGSSNFVTNLGEIGGTTAVYIPNADLAQIRNDGSLIGWANNGVQTVSGSEVELVNTGLIQAHQTAVYFTSSDGRVVNSGTISGGTNGIKFSSTIGSKVYNTETGVISSYPTSDAVAFGTGDDLLINHGQLIGNVVFNGGDDTFKGRSGSVDGNVSGGDGNDTLIGSSADDDNLRGNNDHDTLKGRAGDDVLDGGSGRDHLFGGKDDDTLTGGTQRDYFHFGRNQDHDTITDFENGVDKLELSAFGFSSKAQALSQFFEIGGAANDKVGFDYKGTFIVIKGVDLADIDNADLLI